MAILQLKAARGWSLEQTAREFLVTANTIRSWLKRVDEEGPNALVQLSEPVYKFPRFVRYLVEQAGPTTRDDDSAGKDSGSGESKRF
jgi:hypothetical protein